MLLLVLWSFGAQAQVASAWAKKIGGSNNDRGYGITTDINGNVYTTGYFEGTVDFDPGPGVQNLTSNGNWDIFITKLDANGNLVWAKSIGSTSDDYGYGITTDINGNVYTTGYFEATVDFDPGPGVYNLGPRGGFICKLDINGNFIWAKEYAQGKIAVGQSICMDGIGNIVISGWHDGVVDLDPGVGVANFGLSGYNVFMLKLDNQGNFLWAYSLNTGWGTSNTHHFSLDNTGNVYFGGNFLDTIDVDPGPGIFNCIPISGSDIYIIKLSSAGNFVWAKTIEGQNNDAIASIVLDKTGNIYCTGSFTFTTDFDPGPGIFNLVSNGGIGDIFICKLDNMGNFLWAKSMGGAGWEGGYDIAIDNLNNPYIAGWYDGNFDINPNAGIHTLNCAGQKDVYICKLDSMGNFLWAGSIGGIGEDFISKLAIDDKGNISAIGYFSSSIDINLDASNYSLNTNGGTDIFILKFHNNGVFGRIIFDYNQNCLIEANEYGVNGRGLLLQPGNVIVQTNEFGVWHLDSLPIGNYTITIDTLGSWLYSCPISQSFIITQQDSIFEAPHFGIISTDSCSGPDISVFIPSLHEANLIHRIYIQACNIPSGIDTMIGTYVIVQLDPSLILYNASHPYQSLAVNLYQFNIGNIVPGQCNTILLNCNLDTNVVRGQTLCVQAELFPQDDCVFDTIPNPYPAGINPCNNAYDQSHLGIDAFCDNDTMYFIITNSGTGAMSCHAQTRIFIDGSLSIVDSIQLNTGEADTLIFSGDGRTWRLEVDQHPLHQGHSRPNSTLERCGNPQNWTPNLVNIFPMDDADPIIDIYCGVVGNSYDPNDKTGYPYGLDSSHYIQQNQDIEYVVRFQNTGTAPAINVVIRDTLPLELDIFSARSGASSHDYDFRMYGPHILEWTFNNIMLPDSNINEPESHGFVKFKVKQNRDLPIGTVIKNSAAIYFDFNAPIITNTYFQTIDSLKLPVWDGVATINNTSCLNYTYNGYTYTQSGTYWQPISNNGLDSLYTLNINIIIDSTLTQFGGTLSANQPNATYQWLDCNNGNAPIAGATQQAFAPTANGNYAVQITQGSCTVVSSCYNITNVAVEQLQTLNNIRIYPNPTKNSITIDFGAVVDANIQVFTIAGARVGGRDRKDAIHRVSTANTTQIDLSDYPAGLYMVVVTADGQAPQAFKVSKM